MSERSMWLGEIGRLILTLLIIPGLVGIFGIWIFMAGLTYEDFSWKAMTPSDWQSLSGLPVVLFGASFLGLFLGYLYLVPSALFSHVTAAGLKYTLNVSGRMIWLASGIVGAAVAFLTAPLLINFWNGQPLLSKLIFPYNDLFLRAVADEPARASAPHWYTFALFAAYPIATYIWRRILAAK